MIDNVTFNGKSFRDFGVYIDGSKAFDKPSKDVDNITVLGRNGDLSISNNRFNNIDIIIPCFIRDDFKNRYNALINFLNAQEGYQRLETTEELNVYRMAQFKRSITPETGVFMYYGQFDITFDCKPQVFLEEGEREIKVSSNDFLYNPSYQIAKPLIKVKGIGEITINNRTLSLNKNTGQTYIDCDIQDAYEGTINRNGDLVVASEFPELHTGQNVVSYNGFSEVIIIPRWWRL